jgi:hypothetical protein
MQKSDFDIGDTSVAGAREGRTASNSSAIADVLGRRLVRSSWRFSLAKVRAGQGRGLPSVRVRGAGIGARSTQSPAKPFGFEVVKRLLPRWLTKQAFASEELRSCPSR